MSFNWWRWKTTEKQVGWHD